jgi:predicted phage terminase large subunit-like protein
VASALRELLARVPGQAEADGAAGAEAERLQRVARARADFFFFCQHYLAEAFPSDFAPYQRLLLDVVATRRFSAAAKAEMASLVKPEYRQYFESFPDDAVVAGLLDIEPREHGKTTRMVQALPLWLAVCGAATFPVLCAANQDVAQDLLKSIQQELVDNERLIADFGDLRTKTWAARKIVLANGNAIAAVGAGQALRGLKSKYRRPTHVLVDDMLKDDDAESPKVRQSRYAWLKRAVLNLGKGALTVVTNTILHPDDPPSRLLKEIEAGTLIGWLGLRFSCFVRDDEPAGVPLWPGRWSTLDLRHKRLTLGPVFFATEWRNETIADEDRRFRREWFTFYLPRAVDHRELKKCMGVDPSTGVADGDFGAIITVGKDGRSGLLYVLDVWLDRASELQFAGAIIEQWVQWRAQRVRFEDRAFQAIYKRVVAREASIRGYRLPLQGYKGGNKDLRILSMGPLVENGILQFREREHEDLLTQLLEYPRGHDDGPDALEIAVSGLESTHVGGVPIARQFAPSISQRLSRITGGGQFRAG